VFEDCHESIEEDKDRKVRLVPSLFCKNDDFEALDNTLQRLVHEFDGYSIDLKVEDAWDRDLVVDGEALILNS
jgi:hypothetical protein